MRQGNFPVQAKGHTLVLNWNAQLVPLLRQMRTAQQERGAFEGAALRCAALRWVSIAWGRLLGLRQCLLCAQRWSCGETLGVCVGGWGGPATVALQVAVVPWTHPPPLPAH